MQAYDSDTADLAYYQIIGKFAKKYLLPHPDSTRRLFFDADGNRHIRYVGSPRELEGLPYYDVAIISNIEVRKH